MIKTKLIAGALAVSFSSAVTLISQDFRNSTADFAACLLIGSTILLLTSLVSSLMSYDRSSVFEYLSILTGWPGLSCAFMGVVFWIQSVNNSYLLAVIYAVLLVLILLFVSMFLSKKFRG